MTAAEYQRALRNRPEQCPGRRGRQTRPVECQHRARGDRGGPLDQRTHREHRWPDAVALVRYRTGEDYTGSSADREGLPHARRNTLIGRIKLALEHWRAGGNLL